MNKKKATWHSIARIVLILMSISLILKGIAHILHGSVYWRNYWDGLVFAPFVILVGLFLLYMAIFRFQETLDLHRKREGRKSVSSKSSKDD